MMQLKDKRKLQKKLKVIIPCALAGIIVIFLICIFLLPHTNVALPDDLKGLAFDQSGKVTLVSEDRSVMLEDVKDEIINEGSILNYEPGPIPFFVYSFDNGFYAFSNEKHTLYEVKVDDGDLSYSTIYSFSHLEIIEFKMVNGVFYFVPSDNSSVISYDGKTFSPIFSGAYIESFDVKGDITAVAANDTLYAFAGGDKKSVYLGDRTKDILILKDKIYVLNNFGEEVGKSLIHGFDYNLKSLGFTSVNSSAMCFIGESLYSSGQSVCDFAGELIFSFDAEQEYINIIGNFIYGTCESGLTIYNIKNGDKYMLDLEGVVVLFEHD